MNAIALLVIAALLAGCATRKLDTCVATFAIIGSGLLTFDCRPPPAGAVQ